MIQAAPGGGDYRGRVEAWRKKLDRNGASRGKQNGGMEGEFSYGSVDFSFGDVNQQNLDIHDMRWREAPDDLKEAFRQARRWKNQSWMVGEILSARAAFCNFGLAIEAADPGDAKKLEKFLGTPDEPGNYMRRKIIRYIVEVIEEWYLQDNVISFWRDVEDERWDDDVKLDRSIPWLLLPETVKYTDKFGVEKLYAALQIKEGELKQDATGYNQSDIKRYSASEILVGGKDHPEEHYRVLTRNLRNQGLGWPGSVPDLPHPEPGGEHGGGGKPVCDARAERDRAAHDRMGTEEHGTGAAHHEIPVQEGTRGGDQRVLHGVARAFPDHQPVRP